MTRYAILIITLLIAGVALAQTEPPVEPPQDAPGFTATPNPNGANICYTFECTPTPGIQATPTTTPPTMPPFYTRTPAPVSTPRYCPREYTPVRFAHWYEAFIRPVWCK